ACVGSSPADVDGARLLSPEYSAVTVPAVVNVRTRRRALPPCNDTVPSTLAPSRNLTVPCANAAARLGLTVAVNVTSCPPPQAKGDAVSVTVDVTGFTRSVKTPALPPFTLSPL